MGWKLLRARRESDIPDFRDVQSRSATGTGPMTSTTSRGGYGAARDRARDDLVLRLDPASVWRSTWVVIAALALTSVAAFFFSSGAQVIFTATMGFFASVALEPAVGRLARFMPRALATAIVMVLVGTGILLFALAFGGLLRDQVIQLITSAPALAQGAVSWLNSTFQTNFDTNTVLSQMRLDTASITGLVTTLAGGVLGIVNSIASAAFTTFAFLFFTFYLSADAPRLRVWVAQLFPPRQQVIVLTLWQLTLTKIGGYVAARVVLALICSTCTGVFLYVIDMPYWLPLAIWTGVVAQFVPTIGTYLAISLPVVVGLLGPEPSKGLFAFIFAVVYQQVENLTWEPRISARAVSVHPAVSFASAMLGAALFGVSGALVGVPVSAALIAIFDIYKQRYELSGAAERQAYAAAVRPPHRQRHGGQNSPDPHEQDGQDEQDDPYDPYDPDDTKSSDAAATRIAEEVSHHSRPASAESVTRPATVPGPADDERPTLPQPPRSGTA